MHKEVLAKYGDVMTVGEMPGDLDPYEASKYVAKERKELSMVFQFSHMVMVCDYDSSVFNELTSLRTRQIIESGIFGNGS